MDFEQWKGFEKGEWKRKIDVRNFIQKNYTPYEGNATFLTGTTEKTKKLWDEVLKLYEKERNSNGSVLDIDTKTISTVSAHEAGYIDKDLEEIVGLQTDAPLKRAIMPYGGIKIVEKSCEAYGREVDPEVDKIFHTVRKTHNDGVFSVYTPDIRAARSAHLITGLPDGYGRGRIIGDYRFCFIIKCIVKISCLYYSILILQCQLICCRQSINSCDYFCNRITFTVLCCKKLSKCVFVKDCFVFFV